GAGGRDLGGGAGGLGAAGVSLAAGVVGDGDRLGQGGVGRRLAEGEIAVGLLAHGPLRLGGVDHRLLLGGLREGGAGGHAERGDGGGDDEELAEGHGGRLSHQNRFGFSTRRS